MAVHNSIEAQIRLHEGYSQKLYKCSEGFRTIGVGRNLDANGLRPDEIALLLANDIEEAKVQLDWAAPWWRGLDDVRQKVMVDMMFNLGPKTLGAFRNTLKDIEAGKYQSAAKRMLASRWAKQVGSRARRLADMMRTGEDYRS